MFTEIAENARERSGSNRSSTANSDVFTPENECELGCLDAASPKLTNAEGELAKRRIDILHMLTQHVMRTGSYICWTEISTMFYVVAFFGILFYLIAGLVLIIKYRK